MTYAVHSLPRDERAELEESLQAMAGAPVFDLGQLGGRAVRAGDRPAPRASAKEWFEAMRQAVARAVSDS